MRASAVGHASRTVSSATQRDARAAPSLRVASTHARTPRTTSRVHCCLFAIVAVMSTSEPSPAPCAACGASSLLVCASCLKARFCSPACAAAAWAGHRAACAAFIVLAELPDEAPAPVPPAAPMASMEPAARAGAGSSEPAAFAGSGFACAVCGSSNAAVCARCRLVGYCGAEHQRKDWPTHKAVCRKGVFDVVPVLTWEQRMLAEAHAAAPASLAATAALSPIPEWSFFTRRHAADQDHACMAQGCRRRACEGAG